MTSPAQAGKQKYIIVFVASILMLAEAVNAAQHRVSLSRTRNRTHLALLASERFPRRQESPAPSSSWEEVAKHSPSPEVISQAVRRRVRYSQDITEQDEWRSGRETWARAEGDCEDYAAAVKDLCAHNGYDARIVVATSPTARQAHAVTMGSGNGKVWVSSNGVYREHQSLNDAKQEIARDLGWWAPDVSMVSIEQYNTNSGRPADHTSHKRQE